MNRRSVFRAARVANADLTGWLPDHAVVVEDGRITAVTLAASLPSDVASTRQVTDLGDVSLLPGLVDGHCHMHCSATPEAQELIFSENDERFIMRAVTAMRKALLSGTTTVRDLGSKNEVAFPVLRAIQSGVIPGPRLIVTGAPVTITAGHCWFFGGEADTREAVVQAVRRQVRLGARAIKIMATGGMFTPTANPRRVQYDATTLRAAVDEAERLGVHVAAHTLSAKGVKNCVDAGIHHLVHCRWLDEDPEKGLAYDPDVAKKMADQGQWVDPTIGHHLLGKEAREAGGHPGLPTHWAVARRQVSDEETMESIASVHRAGVRFMMGLDMGMPYADHGMTCANAWAHVEWLGWNTWKAIRASTADTAEALGLGSQLGLVKPGYVADLVAFRGDPAAKIRDLVDVDSVIQGGRPVKLKGHALV